MFEAGFILAFGAGGGLLLFAVFGPLEGLKAIAKAARYVAGGDKEAPIEVCTACGHRRKHIEALGRARLCTGCWLEIQGEISKALNPWSELEDRDATALVKPDRGSQTERRLT
jgi:hypothetical protein